MSGTTPQYGGLAGPTVDLIYPATLFIVYMQFLYIYILLCFFVLFLIAIGLFQFKAHGIDTSQNFIIIHVIRNYGNEKLLTVFRYIVSMGISFHSECLRMRIYRVSRTSRDMTYRPNPSAYSGFCNISTSSHF